MPSQKEVELFQFYSRSAANCWFCGVDIIPSNGMLIPTKSTYKLIAHYSTGIYFVVLITFSLYRNHLMYSVGSSDSVDIALQIIYAFVTITHCTCFSWYFCWVACRAELVEIWNQLYGFNVKGIKEEALKSRREKLMWFGHRTFLFASCLGWISIGTPEFIFGAMQGYPFCVVLGWSSYAVLHCWLYPALFPFMLMFSAMFVIIVHDTLDRLKCEQWDQIEDGIKTFRALQLICKNFNGVYSLTVVPVLKYAGSVLGMVCAVVAIRVNASIPGMNYAFLLFSVFLIGGAILLVNGISAAYVFSVQFLVRTEASLEIVPQNKKRLYLSKALKSLVPLRVCVGGSYYMEKEAKLTFMHFIVHGINNLLLSSK